MGNFFKFANFMYLVPLPVGIINHIKLGHGCSLKTDGSVVYRRYTGIIPFNRVLLGKWYEIMPMREIKGVFG